MIKTKKPEGIETIAIPSKPQQILDLLIRDGGATLEELATLANWLPHSTRAYLTGLRKKEHVIDSDKVDGVRRYRITSSPEA
jgi:predicted transcriptional regulator